MHSRNRHSERLLPARSEPHPGWFLLWAPVLLIVLDDSPDPTVILVDDLHWIDERSEAFLEQVGESIPDTKFLLLVNFRPEYSADWTGRSHYQQLPLVPLGAEAIGELLADLLGDDSSLAGLVAIEKLGSRDRLLVRVSGAILIAIGGLQLGGL